MEEQCSSSPISFTSLMNQDGLTSSPFWEQHSTLSAVSSSFNSREWIGPIQIWSPMRLNECMNFIAKFNDIQNPMDGRMQCTFDRISTNMTDELLKDMLNDYADLFKINFTIIPLDHNMRIDFARTSTFIGASHIDDDQSTHQHYVFILYNHTQQMFMPFYVLRANNSGKVCFNKNERENICKDISNFIYNWNCRQEQCLTSEMNKITASSSNNNHIINGSNSRYTDIHTTQQLPLTLTVDNDVFMPASEVIKTDLQVVLQLIAQMSPQIDHIQLKHESKQALLNNFNHSSDKDKIKMVHDQIISIAENLRIAESPDHEEEIEEISSMEIEDERQFAALGDTANNLNIQIIPPEPNTSCHFKLSSTMNQQTTTVNAQQLNVMLRQYLAPKVSRQPTPYQHVRMFSDLASGKRSLMQGGGKDAPQQTYVEMEVPNQDGTELSIGLRAVTVRKVKHPFKSAIPRNPIIDMSSIHCNGERSCLKCDKNDHDPDSGYTYLPISDDERREGKKEIPVHLINWSRTGTGLKQHVINENLHLCKLEFYLCIRNATGGYQFVSSASYSSIIEEGDGPVNINLDASQERQLCEEGGQTIKFSLTAKCPKRGFCVLGNESKLEFRIHEKQLLIIPPRKTSNNANLELKIVRNEYNDEIEANIDKTLYEGTFTYISHDALPAHTCSRQNLVLDNIDTQ